MENRSKKQWMALSSIWLGSFFLSIFVGRAGFPEFKAILELRLIRALLGTIVGIILASDGAALQALFANPLVEPHTIGISSGAALGYVVAMVIGASLGVRFIFSIGTALLFLTIIYRLSLRDGRLDKVSILLIGISVSFLSSAVLIILFALKGEALVRSIRFIWGYIGIALTKTEAIGFGIASILAILAVVRLWSLSRELDAVSLGESEALGVGVDVELLKRKVFWLSSFTIGLLVSMVGIIGFVGLIVPHLTRKLLKTSSSKLVIPYSAILGATFVLLSDTLSRVIAPIELPVGVVTSLVGIPVFVAIFRRDIK